MPNESLQILLAQLNLTVGDIEGNTQKIITAINEAETKHQTDIIVFPELSISSYPPEDLLFRPAFNKYILNYNIKVTEWFKVIVC